MMKDLVDKLKLDMGPISNCTDPHLLKQEVQQIQFSNILL